MPSFHSSFRNRKEDEWIDGFMRGLKSEEIIEEVMSEVIDASASRSSMFNEEEENNTDPEYQETNKFVPQENANVDHFVPQENENAEQFVPPVDQFETREEPRYDNNQVQNIDTSYMGQSQPTEEGSGPGLDPSKSYKLYSIQFNKTEYINIGKQILKGHRQLIKRKMEGRGVFVNVKKRKEEK